MGKPNVGYAFVDAVIVTPEKLAAAEKVLADNGIDPDETETVLQALGYVLLGTELYPEENGPSETAGSREG